MSNGYENFCKGHYTLFRLCYNHISLPLSSVHEKLPNEEWVAHFHKLINPRASETNCSLGNVISHLLLQPRTQQSAWGRIWWAEPEPRTRFPRSAETTKHRESGQHLQCREADRAELGFEC